MGKKCRDKALFVGSCVKTCIFKDAGEQQGKHCKAKAEKPENKTGGGREKRYCRV